MNSPQQIERRKTERIALWQERIRPKLTFSEKILKAAQYSRALFPGFFEVFVMVLLIGAVYLGVRYVFLFGAKAGAFYGGHTFWRMTH